MTLPQLPKPAHGAPCNSCGRCCQSELCPLASALFKREAGPCPALQPGEGQALVCGLIVNPMRFALRQTLRNGTEAMSAAAAHLVGAGHGCDAQFADEPRDLAFSARLRAHGASHRAFSRVAAKMWGVS